MMVEPTNVTELFEQMKENFSPEKAANIDGTIQLKLTGEGGGDYYLELKNGTFNPQQGAYPNPNMTITASVDDYIKVSTGKLDGMMAFFQGKLKVQGDVTLAQKMQRIFKK
jgi:putative sterol carrier protein